MRITEMIQKIDRIDQLIRMKATGSPRELCERLEISKSTWHELKKMMIEDLKFPIAYNKSGQTYYYTEQGQYYPPVFRTLKHKEMNEIIGKGYRRSFTRRFIITMRTLL